MVLEEDDLIANARENLKGLIEHLQTNPDLALEFWKVLSSTYQDAERRRWADRAPEPMPEPPCVVRPDRGRVQLIFTRYVMGELGEWATEVEALLSVHRGKSHPITVNLTECRTLTGDWARWLNTLCEYPEIEVLLGDQQHHRTSFSARNLVHLLSRIS